MCLGVCNLPDSLRAVGHSKVIPSARRPTIWPRGFRSCSIVPENSSARRVAHKPNGPNPNNPRIVTSLGPGRTDRLADQQ
jgi:hypothetical protein